jgi:hypothetical protein
MEHWERIKKEILEEGDPDLKIEMALVSDIRTPSSNKRRFVVSTLGIKDYSERPAAD